MKRIPFTIEKFNELGGISKCKCVTRDGQPVLIYTVSRQHRLHKIAGDINSFDAGPAMGIWGVDGRFDLHNESSYDLFILDETAPKLRAWSIGEVPVGALIRHKEWAGNGYFTTILSRGSSGVSFSYNGGIWVQTREQIAEQWEHSTDGGKTWHPCGVLE